MCEPLSGHDDTWLDCRCEIEDSCPLCVGDRLADMVDDYENWDTND